MAAEDLQPLSIVENSGFRNMIQLLDSRWDIFEKVVAVVTDGRSNIKGAVRLMDLSHLPCTAHKLNLVVQNSLKLSDNQEIDPSDDTDKSDLKKLFKKCRNMVSFFRRSEVGNRMLVEKQKQLGCESVLKLKQDIRTRWNSTFLMLERLIKLKEPLTIVMITIREAPKQYPTLSTIIPLIRGLQSSLVSKTQTTRLGMYIKNKLIENTNRRFDSIEKQTITPNFSRATMLDPRCKKVAFGSEQNANETERYLVNETAALISNASNAEQPTYQENLNTDDGNVWNFLNYKVTNVQSQTITTSSATSLMRRYLSMPHQNLKCNVAVFWNDRKTVLSPLSDIALKYCIIPATSVSAERIFSKAGQILNARLYNLNLKILFTMNNPKKRFESGASKRKRKAEEERKSKLLPPVSKFFTKNLEIEKPSPSNSFSSNDIQDMPSSPSPSSPINIIPHEIPSSPPYFSVSAIAHETLSSFSSSLSTNGILEETPSNSSSFSPIGYTSRKTKGKHKISEPSSSESNNCINSTQDVSKVDQVSTIYRYVHIEKDELGIPKSIEIKEDFIGFSEAEGGTGEAMEEQTIEIFKENGLDIGKFRGIGLDGAASMSGKHNDLQTRLRKRQKKAKYVHCASHNLNLVVNDSVKNIAEIRQFFEMLETLYTFFGNSILRWSMLKKESSDISRSLKRLCPTRWSSRIDYLISLNHMNPDVMKVLNNITLTGRNKDEQDDASTLKKYFESYETIILIIVMYKILSKINLASKILQSPGADIGKAVDLIKNTMENMLKIRDNFNNLMEEANSKAKVKKFYDELCQDQCLLQGNRYFETQVWNLRLPVIPDDEISESTKKLAEEFQDFNPAELATQIESFKCLFASELMSISLTY
ncbi:hypothetical protein QTP88_010228 [Uroleucon formosanum]